MQYEPQVGALVFSKAGRDKHRPMVIIRVEEPYVFVADGSLRKLEKPKKKKRMHLRITPKIAKEIANLLQKGILTNHHIEQALLELTSQTGEGGQLV